MWTLVSHAFRDTRVVPWLRHQDNPNATAATFMQEWAARQYDGSPVAAQVAELWGEYFQVPYITDGMSDSHLGGAIASLSQLLTADLLAGKVQPATVKQGTCAWSSTRRAPCQRWVGASAPPRRVHVHGRATLPARASHSLA